MSEITYDGICKKLGFRPDKVKKEKASKDDYGINDNKVNPYSVLTYEEKNFLFKRLQSLGHL